MNTITIDDIEGKAKDYAARRELLGDYVAMVDAELAAIKRKHLKELKRRVALAAESESALRAAIEAVPDLFEKPKTRIFHGIKVGYRKGKGGLDWEDDAALVGKIEQLFLDDNEADRYLIVTKTPSAEALEDLDAATLKRLGVHVVNNGEQVVIKPVETDIEKLVKALLKGAAEETE